jgi:S1-C subfamily serine protease
MFKILKICTIGVLFVLNTAYADSAKIKDIETIKKAIVTINSRVPVSAYQNTGSWSGTGFIVDSKNGYLVTNNRKVL